MEIAIKMMNSYPIIQNLFFRQVRRPMHLFPCQNLLFKVQGTACPNQMFQLLMVQNTMY